MPFVKRSGTNSQISSKLREKRKKIIEEERIRILGDALLLFYDKLRENYDMIYPVHKADENIKYVNREEVETLARKHAATKPTGY